MSKKRRTRGGRRRPQGARSWSLVPIRRSLRGGSAAAVAGSARAVWGRLFEIAGERTCPIGAAVVGRALFFAFSWCHRSSTCRLDHVRSIYTSVGRIGMTTHLPGGDKAVLDIRKIEDYCLSPIHPRGRHKARVFREALDWAGRRKMVASSSAQGRERGRRNSVADRCLGKPLACRCDRRKTRKERRGKNEMDYTNRRSRAEVRHLLGAVMKARKRTKNGVPSMLDVVALLSDLSTEGLARGQVGTVVEQLDDRTFLVEFSDDQGRAYAIAPCPQAELLVCITSRRRPDKPGRPGEPDAHESAGAPAAHSSHDDPILGNITD